MLGPAPSHGQRNRGSTGQDLCSDLCSTPQCFKQGMLVWGQIAIGCCITEGAGFDLRSASMIIAGNLSKSCYKGSFTFNVQFDNTRSVSQANAAARQLVGTHIPAPSNQSMCSKVTSMPMHSLPGTNECCCPWYHIPAVRRAMRIRTMAHMVPTMLHYV